jgi:hypothetical protein
MEPFDINKIRDLLDNPHCPDVRTLHVVRCFIPSWEAVLEIHCAKKSQFESREDFLQESLMNTYGIASHTDAKEELSAYDDSSILNRKASMSEVGAVYRKLSPISASLPWKILIRDAIILFINWNIAWLFIETYEGSYVSAKWYTTA